MKDRTRFRRVCVVLGCLAVFLGAAVYQLLQQPWHVADSTNEVIVALGRLTVSQRIVTSRYERTYFGDGWESKGGCDTRNIILSRDLTNIARSGACTVVRGTLSDPYTGSLLQFERGASTSEAVQIDHVVPLKDAWQKGAYALSYEKRVALANDPLELIAVDGRSNQQKSDGDAAEWLPSYRPFRCQYVARQVAVKLKYDLSVTNPEKQAMQTVLERCPRQSLPKK